MDTRLRLEEMLPRIIASEKETTNFYKFRTNFLEAWSSGSQSEYELQLQFQSKIKFLEFFSLLSSDHRLAQWSAASESRALRCTELTWKNWYLG